MSLHLSLFLLFTTLTTATTHHHHSPSPSPSPSTQPPPPISKPSPPPSQYMQQQQLNNIIDALIGAGDFAAWANILFNPITSPNSSIPPLPGTRIPTAATLFVPGNDALSRLSGSATGAYSFDPYIIPYHVIPQRLTFSDLQLFKTRTRIPTLLPSKTILITDDTPTHFTIDDSLIVQPDIYSNEAVCVHGVANILDYKAYGDAAGQTPPSFVSPPPEPPLTPAEETVSPPTEGVSSTGVVVACVGGFLIRFVVASGLLISLCMRN